MTIRLPLFEWQLLGDNHSNQFLHDGYYKIGQVIYSMKRVNTQGSQIHSLLIPFTANLSRSKEKRGSHRFLGKDFESNVFY